MGDWLLFIWLMDFNLWFKEKLTGLPCFHESIFVASLKLCFSANCSSLPSRYKKTLIINSKRGKIGSKKKKKKIGGCAVGILLRQAFPFYEETSTKLSRSSKRLKKAGLRCKKIVKTQKQPFADVLENSTNFTGNHLW